MEGYIVYSRYGLQTHIFRRVYDDSLDSGNIKGAKVYETKEEAEQNKDQFYNLVGHVNLVTQYGIIFGDL